MKYLESSRQLPSYKTNHYYIGYRTVSTITNIDGQHTSTFKPIFVSFNYCALHRLNYAQSTLL